ncbi:MAG: DUF1508 domain-containing protein [Christensenellaceae bacterium]|jgi:uncharacterized protein YegP (UPF0339 family)|nr:DUF1508 domain-containing protein [Christensenellaceae bacterium]
MFEKIIEFLTTGYNAAYLGGALVVLVIILVLTIRSIKNTINSKKVAETESLDEFAVLEEKDLLNHYEDEIDYSYLTADLEDEDEIVEKKKKEPPKIPLVNETADVLVELKPIAPKEKPLKIVEEIKLARQEYSFDDSDSFEDYFLNFDGTILVYPDFACKYRARYISPTGQAIAHTPDVYDRNLLDKIINSINTIAPIATLTDLNGPSEFRSYTKPEFALFKDSDSKTRFKLIAANLDVLLTSKGYNNKEECLKGIKSLLHVISKHKLKEAHENRFLNDMQLNAV